MQTSYCNSCRESLYFKSLWLGRSRLDRMKVGQKNILIVLSRYAPKLHEGVARFAAEHNWHLNAEFTYFGKMPRRWRGDGILTLLDKREDIVQFVSSAGVPRVDLSIIRGDIAIPRVAGDNHLIGRLAGEHFLERGFRHFCSFSSIGDALSDLRLLGFHETVTRAGFFCERWVFQQPADPGVDDWTAKRAFLVNRLLGIAKPAAVFAFCDADAASVLDACDQAGLAVPEEIAVMGVDNNELICNSLRVPLSSVNQDFEEIGYVGALLLDRLMAGEPAPQHPILVPPKGVTIRRSTDIFVVGDEQMRRALQFLGANYRRRIGASEAAAACGMSRKKLDSTFREHLGSTVNDYLLSLRLVRAKELLRQSDLPAADVAAQAGFNTPQYFNTFFRKATGMTPGRFRACHRARPELFIAPAGASRRKTTRPRLQSQRAA